MAIVRGDVTVAEGGTTATSITLTKPSTIADGSVLVAFIGDNVTSTPTLPTGWTLRKSAPAALGTVMNAFIYYKVITNAGGEPASYAWTGYTAGRITGFMVEFSGVDNVNPFDVAESIASNASSATLTLTGITTVTDGCMLLSCAGQDSATGTDTVPGSPWARITDGVDSCDSTGTGKRFGAASAAQATAGATGNISWTFNSATLTHTGILAALRPAVVAAATVPPLVLARYGR